MGADCSLQAHASRKSFPYLPLLVLAWVCEFAYLQLFLNPYDIPSLAFFTVGIYLIYRDRFWALLALFAVATLNRETTFFLIVLLILNEMVETDGVTVVWQRAFRRRCLLRCAILSLTWVALQLLVHHLFRNNGSGEYSRLQKNMAALRHPQYWPEFLSICGFSLPILVLFNGRIRDVKIRLYLLVVPVWIAIMLVYGELLEMRIYGELSGLIALAITLMVEGSFVAEPEDCASPARDPTGGTPVTL